MNETIWTTLTATATKCGHPYPIQTTVNDMGETVTIHAVYPDPNAETFTYDAPELCERCYFAAMNARPLMTPRQFSQAWRPQ